MFFCFLAALILVAIIIPFAFHGTNGAAFILDIILVIVLTFVFYAIFC